MNRSKPDNLSDFLLSWKDYKIQKDWKNWENHWLTGLPLAKGKAKAGTLLVPRMRQLVSQLVISAGSQWPSVHLPLNWWHLQWPTALMQHHHANNHRDQWVFWSSSTEEIKSNCLSSKPWLQQDVSFASAGGVQTYWINVTASFFSAFRVMQQCTVSFGTFRRTVSAIYRAATLALSPASQTLWLLGIAAWNLEAVLLSLLLVSIDIDTPVTSITAWEYVANIVQWCMYMNK